MQDQQSLDPNAISTAFQALLKNHRATCLFIDRQNRLMHICGDHLGLLPPSANGIASPQNAIHLLPSALKSPAAAVLTAAQQQGEAKQTDQAIDIRGTLHTVTISATLHTLRTTEFLTLIIEPILSPEDLGTHYQWNQVPEAASVKNEQLQHGQPTQQKLAQQTQALEQSNANLEEFAYIVSHDLQEPLRAMTAFSQLLLQRHGKQLDESAQRYIRHIVDGGNRMKAMIDGILELSRINQPQRHTNSLTDLEQALATALDNLDLMRLESQATITHDPLPHLWVAHSHIVQLLQNLISNAIKFRGTDIPHIHISAQQQSHHWLFRIQDNGMGIPQNQQKRIFKLFQRLHSQQEYQGYGIGLTICQKIVEHYHGNIWLKSVHGEGSVFYFTLAAHGEPH